MKAVLTETRDIQSVRDQLIDYCDCIKKKDDSAEFDKNLNELISILSVMTCWTREPCETFLNEQRTESIKLGEYEKCGCNAGVIEFTPHYNPFEIESIEIDLVELNGIDETITRIDQSDIVYSQAFDLFRINIGKYTRNDRCGCVGDYRLLIRYWAGYEQIPDCLLQIFCDMMHIIYLKNKCDCKECQSCKTIGATETDIVYSDGDNISKVVAEYLNTIITTGIKKQLGLISLCNRNKNDIWGAVV